MTRGIQIGCLTLFLLHQSMAGAQTGQDLLPFTNRLLMNPAYAGWNKNTSVRTSLTLLPLSNNNINHTFTATYDRWSEKLKGGTAYYFYTDLEDKTNTNAAGAGFTYSKPFKTGYGNMLIPAVHFSIKSVFRQWYFHAAEAITETTTEQPDVQAADFMQYTIPQPGLGILWHTNTLDLGLSALFSFHQPASEHINREMAPVQLIFHITGEKSGKQRGLTSLAYHARPEFTLLYTEDLLYTRAGVINERKDKLSGFFVQNNFSDQLHGMTAVIGWKLHPFRFIFALGGVYSIPGEKMSLTGEASLGLSLPWGNDDQHFPWSPKTKK